MTLAGSAVSLMAMTTCIPTHAQAETQDSSAIATEPADGSAIVVTGSRIARPELESAMPIGIIDMQDAMEDGNTPL